MNEQEFALLVENYLDGTLTVKDRQALQQAVTEHPAHRQMFEEQARQHVRLHAQSGRVDFTDSQRLAAMVVDVVAQERTASPLPDFLEDRSWRERARDVAGGLRAPRDSVAYREARFALLRILGPGSVALALTALALLLLFTYAIRPLQPLEDEWAAHDAIRLVPAIQDILAKIRIEEPSVVPADDRQLESSANNALKEVIPAPDVSGAAPGGEGAESPPGGPRPGDENPVAAASLTPARHPVVFKTLSYHRSRTRQADSIRRFGGDPMTTNAVVRALQWFRAQQLGNGAWPGQEPVAMTALVLLNYLAHGDTPISQDFGPGVERALKYLLTVQNEKGSFSANAYAHAIATYAMAEAYGLTRILILKDSMEKGIRVITDGQQTEGGFDYGYAKNGRFDTSVSGWQFQALKAAKLAGAGEPGLDDAIRRGIQFLKKQSFAADGSGFVYSGTPGQQASGGATWIMTGVGTLSLQFLADPGLPQVKSGLKALEPVGFTWPRNDQDKAPVYGGYYVTQAKFHQGGTAWTTWNQQFERELLANQKADGHWENGDHESGSYVYTTAFCALMLQVYYRYEGLGTFRKVEPTLQTGDATSNEVPVYVR